MHVKALFMGAVLASLGPVALADMIPTPDGIAVKTSDVATPARGMTMEQVTSKFGAPVNKIAAVGSPPISRWEYPGFVVYFEGDHVIHCVVGSTPASSADGPPASPAPAPQAASAPAASG